MPKAFVTGATGFIGLNLVEQLAEQGWDIVVFHRDGSDTAPLDRFDVEHTVGSLTSPETVGRAIRRGIDCVFHLAADTSNWRGHRKRQKAVNYFGTRAVVHAAQDAGVGRFVHVSTASVWSDRHGLVDETTPQTGRKSWVGYIRTKAMAEEFVRAECQRGLNAVICNPAHVLGRYDRSNWAGLFNLVANDTLPGVPPGGGCFANGREVARALIAAAERGRPGENYILAGPHARFVEVVGEIGRLVGKPTPDKATPAIAIKTMAAVNQLVAHVTRRRPAITPEAAYFLYHDEHLNCDKAVRELGYKTVPLATSLAESHAWLTEQGLL